ncbi:glycoside hydrolase family 43 protein [Hortaea werneckii]|nr:glycoside hydrolase family 43 protein [Hortaea werneckii]
MRLQDTALFLLLATALAENNDTFFNPILPGFHPDPSCISVPDLDWTFFCATSSFAAFPGIPIHASKDLVHWKLISNALARPEQLPDLAIINGSTSGIWAPSLRYHDGTFYIMTTLVFDHEPQSNVSRWDNFLISTTDPYNSTAWSDPIHFPFVGYDTDPFWDPQDNNKTYVTGSHAYRIYPAITQAPIDLNTGELEYDPVILWNGTGGNAPEGPHVYYKDDYYYLMIAEGGTGIGHMETIARSRSLNGEYYHAYEGNPIVTNANTSAYFQTVGHADLFQDRKGQWWGVALSTRTGPEYEVFPMGRESVLAPVTWHEGEWPIWSNITGKMEAWPLPPSEPIHQGEGQLINTPDHLTFPPNSTLPPHLIHWRIPVRENYQVSAPDHPNTLQLTASFLNLTGHDGVTASHPQGQTFLARRQVDTFFTFAVNLDISDLRREGDEAGVSVFLTQNHHYDLGIVMLPSSSSSPTSSQSLTPHFRLRGISTSTTSPDFPVLLQPVNQTWLSSPPHQNQPHPASQQTSNPIRLEIQATNLTHYALSAAPSGAEHLRQTLGYSPARGVSYGFTGVVVGVYCTVNGREGEEGGEVGEGEGEGKGGCAGGDGYGEQERGSGYEERDGSKDHEGRESARGVGRGGGGGGGRCGRGKGERGRKSAGGSRPKVWVSEWVYEGMGQVRS